MFASRLISRVVPRHVGIRSRHSLPSFHLENLVGLRETLKQGPRFGGVFNNLGVNNAVAPAAIVGSHQHLEDTSWFPFAAVSAGVFGAALINSDKVNTHEK